MSKPAKFLRGRCGITNWICPGHGNQPPMMFAADAWRGVDLEDSKITFNVQHDEKQHIGRNRLNGRVWQEGRAIGFEIDTETLTRDLATDLRCRVLLDKLRGSSPQFDIAEHHWQTFDGVEVCVIDRVAKLNHLAVAEYGLCPLATIAAARESAFPGQTLQNRAVLTAGRKRPLMRVPQMPKGMRDGIALANAALRGESVRIDGRTLAATTVQAICVNAGPYSIH